MGVIGGVDSFDEKDCTKCKGKMRNKRTGKECARCKGTGFEPDTQRHIPCPTCTKPIIFHFDPEYDDKRWQYVVCGECATDWYLVQRLGHVVSMTKADV